MLKTIATASAATEEGTPPGMGDALSIARLSEARIMMVDDDALMTDTVQAYLEEAGYARFICTNDPRTALETARRESPDLLLLDLVMPHMSGFEVLQSIRAEPDLKYLPVIVLTAAAEPEYKLKALELGASEFLAKPVDSSELVLRVRNSLAFKIYQDYLAYSDTVTGLPNRKIFMRGLEATINRASFEPTTFALLHVDLDRFKQINDTLGHFAGDELLRATAERLNTSLRGGDLMSRVKNPDGEVLARTGGDEFTILLPKLASTHNADQVARRLMKTIAAPFDIGEREIFLTASVGISVFPGDGANAETLLNNAESAMYQAKENGRNRVEFYRDELNSVTLERLDLESQLHRALERNELRLYYQPKVNVASGAITATEALLRWQHPRLGLVSPGQFIGIAEESGLIVPIGDWVIEEACRQGSRWAQEGLAGFTIAVNVSSYQVSGDRLLGIVRHALETACYHNASLVLELTESMLMRNPEQSLRLLGALKEIGPQLSIDDFGTGYSSLSYLKRFPLDELKIDRSFVSGIPEDETDVSIVRAILALAESLGLKTVAEGVETQAQLDALRALGCDTYQGYFCSVPLPPDEFAKLVRDARSAASTS